MKQARRPDDRRRRLLAGGVSVGAHLAAVAVLVAARPEPQVTLEPPPIVVQLVTPEPPPPPPEPPAPKPDPAPKATPVKAKPKPAKPPPPRHVARAAKRPPPDVVPIPAGEGPSADGFVEVSDSELAGAGTAESGGAGGGAGCNMTQRLQAALRKDRLVRAAMAEAHRGQAIRVWNGDWVKHGAQEGAGLAAVREAIMWEVGFAPEACRRERVRGLIVVSLNDGPGAARLVVGTGDWRWGDVLFARGASSSVRRP